MWSLISSHQQTVDNTSTDNSWADLVIYPFSTMMWSPYKDVDALKICCYLTKMWSFHKDVALKEVVTLKRCHLTKGLERALLLRTSPHREEVAMLAEQLR